MSDLVNKIASELLRVEEDTTYSSKGHFNASDNWKSWHLVIGLPAAVVTALAGATAFADQAMWAGILASIGTAFTTILTFLKPSGRASMHKAYANQYLTLRSRARIFREIGLGGVDLSDAEGLKALKKELLSITSKRDELNQSAPNVPRKSYELARKDIEENRHTHEVDV